MQCMIYEPSPSVILEVIFIVDIRKQVMDIVDLIIQVLKPYSVVGMVSIL